MKKENYLNNRIADFELYVTLSTERKIKVRSGYVVRLLQKIIINFLAVHRRNSIYDKWIQKYE